jgi:hypothetical protein
MPEITHSGVNSTEGNPDASLQSTPEQVRYANFLEKGMYTGLTCLFVTFSVYAFGIIEPHIPLEKIPEYWTMSVHDYLIAAEVEAGWGWVSMLGYGDFLNFVGIAILAGISAVCYLGIIPLLLKKRDYIYAGLALLEVIVLVVAASGVIAVGH